MNHRPRTRSLGPPCDARTLKRERKYLSGRASRCLWDLA
jgi:hypothetical protein